MEVNKLEGDAPEGDYVQLTAEQKQALNRAHLASARAVTPAPNRHEQRNKWEAAIDDALVVNHLGTTDSFEDAKEALGKLIQWEIQVATDPAVNGGYVLVKQRPAPDEALIEEIVAQYVLPPQKFLVREAIHEFIRRSAGKEKS